MNEEEIITRIHDLIHTCDVGIEKHGEYDDLFELDKKALQGLLDLYNKEKEKNEKLQMKIQFISINNLDDLYEQTLEKTMTNFLNENINEQFINKEKIKDEIENLKNMNVEGEVFTTAVNYARKILEELLK